MKAGHVRARDGGQLAAAERREDVSFQEPFVLGVKHLKTLGFL